LVEHLFNTDKFFEESQRVLKKNGYLIITTPNLCAWFNRIFMLFGIQPLFLEPSTKSKLIGAGPLKRFKKESQPVGHVRILTINAIKDLLKENGFELKDIKGAVYDQGLPEILLPIDKIFAFFPSLASILVVIAQKK
jgi:2-polyprenyl-3-methyl-5-hydroxy-6-metoxy-1,4-benzoquinol methylase